MLKWVRSLLPPPRYPRVLFDPWNSSEHQEHRTEPVSRHAIAETGLTCPRCGTLVAARGDYSLVQRSNLGEIICCPGKLEINGHEQACGFILVASPDTEHGDNLAWDATPKRKRFKQFYSFVRISYLQGLRDLWGGDIGVKDGTMTTSKTAPAAVKPSDPLFQFSLNDYYTLEDGNVAHIQSIEQRDILYRGWAKVTLNNRAGEFWADPIRGFIRMSMSDPTMDDIRIIEKHRPV